MADIAIVGGGPAGLSCAISLAICGIKVAVFEPKALPIDKPCGEGIMPEGVNRLRELGVFQYLDRREATFFDGICFINERGHRAVSEFSQDRGLGCRRLALSQALYRRCQDFSSIEFFREKITGIKVGKRNVSLQFANGTYDARLLVGADGLRSRVRAMAGLKGPDTKIKRFGLRRHFAIKPWSHQVEVYFRRGIEAYITPCGDKQTNITFLWSKDLLPSLYDSVSFEALIDLFPHLAARIRNIAPVSEQMAIGPLHQRSTHVVADGIALLGDASGYYDAITGEGISIALAQSKALASALSQLAVAKKRSVISAPELKPYEHAHRAIIKSYYRNTGLLLWFARRPRLMQTMIRLGQLQPKTFNFMIEASRRH